MEYGKEVCKVGGKFNYSMLSHEDLSLLRLRALLEKKSIKPHRTAQERLLQLKKRNVNERHYKGRAVIKGITVADEVAGELIEIEGKPRVQIDMPQVDIYLRSMREHISQM